MSARLYDNGFQYCQCLALGRDIYSTEIQYPPANMIMSISHPWPHATGEYAALGPQYVALGPQDAALSLYSGASGT